MKKVFLALLVSVACGTVFSGQVGLPVERIELPDVQGSYLVCIWDETAGQWLQAFETYDLSGSYSFQLPEWSKWYWIGLWNESTGTYIFEKWVGHFPTK